MIVQPASFLPTRGDAPPMPAAQSESDGNSLGFWDLVDVVNPLQHLPVVGVLYRELTGDKISAPARIAGGLLFGGPLGMAASAADVGLEAISGETLGEHVMAWLEGEPDGAPKGRAMAAYRGAAGAYDAAGGGGGTSLCNYEIDIPC